jgi:hypothetical protein
MVNNIKGYGIGQVSHQKTNMDCFTVFISYFLSTSGVGGI